MKITIWIDVRPLARVSSTMFHRVVVATFRPSAVLRLISVPLSLLLIWLVVWNRILRRELAMEEI